ncbi:ABC transporter permease [Psychrobacter sp. JCM 18903]|uniref:ABC transporter permease n=1 Tax=Psychrobacter sp. JCM 18903 TaxID=1298610 RepID=UPI0004B51922|nr:ABC transporter permease [Psychrobacter sp. JCM 18903]
MKLSKAFLRSAAYERRFLTKNPWDFSMVVWIPLATVLLIWWIFSQTQITDLPIGVIDQDNSPIANTAVRYLEASPTLTVRQLYYSEAEAKAAILQRDIYAIVIIPEDFSRHILSAEPAPLILQVNAQYGTHSALSKPAFKRSLGRYRQALRYNAWSNKAWHRRKLRLLTHRLAYSVSACLMQPPIISSFWLQRSYPRCCIF